MWPPPLARISEDKALWLEMTNFVRKSKRFSHVLCATRALPLEKFYNIQFSSLSHFVVIDLAPPISGIGDFGHSGPTSRSSWLYQRGEPEFVKWSNHAEQALKGE